MNIEKHYKEILENKDSFAVNEHTGEVSNCSKCACCNCKLDSVDLTCDEARLEWLFEEYKESLLTKDEKEFLKSFIDFFGCRILRIRKMRSLACSQENYLEIGFGSTLNFTPHFDKYKLFKNLEEGKDYTLKDLDIDE